MAIELEEFHREFFQDVHASADVGGQYVEDAFFDMFCEYLVDAGELETADRASYVSPRGFRIDGYGGDPINSENVLSLIIADFNQSPAISTLTATDLNSLFKRSANFLNQSLKESFRNSLDESSPAFGLADLIAARWSSIDKVRLFAISNRELSARIDGRPAGELQGTPVTYNVWDLARLHRFATSGHGREEIKIDLANDFGGPLPALPAHLDEAGYESYLIVIPGERLAAIYDRWGARLLEQNVRVFLQARGGVNKGIRNTIENEPEMFFAYNNGITATAEGVQSIASEEGLLITSLDNLQIVNGGQTTASIHAASRKKDIDLSKIFVQMKLSVIDSALAYQIVPNISRYANTQNRISAADFFSNHPFHIRMEDFSRRLFAPSPDGTFRESKWFYERARGQFQDERAKFTPTQRKKFDLEFPRRQAISKTDLAKYLNVWAGHPDTVSKGAQKNFAEFAKGIGEDWEKQQNAFNEAYFRRAVAMAIVFREVEKLVTAQTWYDGGYRANVVAYAIAKLGCDVDRRGLAVDFERIWRKQGVSPDLQEALTISAKAVHEVIVNPDAGTRNVTEWAKQPACWSRVKALKIDWPDRWLEELITRDEQIAIEQSAKSDQRVLNGIEAQTAVVNAGGDVWRNIREWGVGKRLLSQKEADILAVAAAIPNRIPTDKQSIVAIEALKKLHLEGCQIGLDIPPVA